MRDEPFAKTLFFDLGALKDQRASEREIEARDYVLPDFFAKRPEPELTSYRIGNADGHAK